MKKLLITVMLGALLLPGYGYAADTKISAMTEDTAPAVTSIVPIVTGGANKMAAMSNFPFLLKSLGTGKGTLVGFSAASTPGTLAAGTDGYILVADTASALGVKWVQGVYVTDIYVLSSATPTPAVGTLGSDIHYYLGTDGAGTNTGLAEAATFGAPTGTPIQGQKLRIRIFSDATPRALDFNAIYRFGDIAKPTTTVASKTQYIGFIYNATDTKWDCVGSLGGL